MGNRAKHNAKPKRDFVATRELSITKVPAPEGLDLTKPWFLVYTAPRMELKAEEGLLKAGCQVFLPKLHRVIRFQRREITHDLATFPRYIFASGVPTMRRDSYLVGPDGKSVVTINGRPLTDIREIDGVQDILRSRDGFAIVPRRAIEAVICFQNDQKLPRIEQPGEEPRFAVGEPVRIIAGPFMGFQATVVEQIGLHQADVMIEIFGRSNVATFDTSHLDAA